MRWARRAPDVPGERDPGASMALLDQVLDPPVGPGYRSAADARVDAGLPASSGTRTWLMFLAALALGVLGTVAAVTLRSPEVAVADTRGELISRIEAVQDAGDEHRRQVEELRAEIVLLEQQALATATPTSPEDPAGGEQIASAAIDAGAVSVRGPGVIITLADAAARETAPGETTTPERITSRDIQLVVNGLWSAGAEAISVNDHRLTTTSAIRFAGQAIIVDFRGLAPPYEIRAIGDPDRLAAETSTGLVGAYLGELRTALALRAEVAQVAETTIVPAERLITRLSTVAPTDQPADPPAGTDNPMPSTAPPSGPTGEATPTSTTSPRTTGTTTTGRVQEDHR